MSTRQMRKRIERAERERAPQQPYPDFDLMYRRTMAALLWPVWFTGNERLREHQATIRDAQQQQSGDI